MSGSARRPERVAIATTPGRSARREPNDTSVFPSLATLIANFDGFSVNGALNVGLSNLDPITTWTNIGTGGATYNPTNGTADQKPLFYASRLNSHPGVVFDAVDDYLKATANPIAATAARHIFTVVEIPAVTGAGGGLVLEFNNAVGYTLSNAAETPTMGNNGSGTAWRIASAPSAGVAIVETVFDGTTTHLPTIRINGIAQSVSNSGGTGVGTETDTATLWLGYHYGAAIGQILIWTGNLSAADAAQARVVLTDKWGISS